MDNYFDISKMGCREAERASKLLVAYCKECPDTFYDKEVRLAYNPASGCVFLTNGWAQTLMLDGNGKASVLYFLSNSGYEGFAEDLYADFKNGKIYEQEDLEQLRDILRSEGLDEEAEAVEKAISKIQ